VLDQVSSDFPFSLLEHLLFSSLCTSFIAISLETNSHESFVL
jgi:hypothetical protein